MIYIKNVSKTFNNDEFYALKDVNLHVKKGQICVLNGASGSGKSTLLSLIARLYTPSFGEIIINNINICNLSENFASAFRRKNIGIIFQKFNLIMTLSAIENILLPSIVDKKNVSAHANELLKKFDLFDKKDILAKNLSGGEQQRVAIIRALINSPKLILADEPTANLDQKLSEKFLDYLKFIKEQNCTCIIATHDKIFDNFTYIDKRYYLQKVTK